MQEAGSAPGCVVGVCCGASSARAQLCAESFMHLNSGLPLLSAPVCPTPHPPSPFLPSNPFSLQEPECSFHRNTTTLLIKTYRFSPLYSRTKSKVLITCYSELPHYLAQPQPSSLLLKMQRAATSRKSSLPLCPPFPLPFRGVPTVRAPYPLAPQHGT